MTSELKSRKETQACDRSSGPATQACDRSGAPATQACDRSGAPATQACNFNYVDDSPSVNDEYSVSQSHNYESSVNYESSSVNCESSEDEEEVKPKSDSTLLCLLVLAGLGYYMYVQKYTYLE